MYVRKDVRLSAAKGGKSDNTIKIQQYKKLRFNILTQKYVKNK